MRTLSVINDWHLGVLRSAGTTPSSALELRKQMLKNAKQLLNSIDSPLLVNGDLFDKESIPFSDMLETWEMFRAWLRKGYTLYLSPGNHDLSKNSSILSSFQFFASLLETEFDSRVEYISGLTEIQPGVYVLPHLPNQDRLEAELAKVPDCEVLFVHTNFENNFAVQSDNSLNISLEQAAKCKAKYIVFGHEHQQRTAIEGKVLIPGNQFPSSVSDCIGNLTRQMVVLEDNVPSMTDVGTASFKEMDWRELEDCTAEFIRVTGTAQPEEGAEVAQKISKYRSKSDAFVVTNAVQMLTSEGKIAEEFAQSLESVSAFDVMAALLKHLGEEEKAAIKALPL